MSPVFEVNGRFYFYDLLEDELPIGPYDTHTDAIRAYNEYIDFLEGVSYGYS